MQIFTSNILQNKPGEEVGVVLVCIGHIGDTVSQAPFLEFIERRCSQHVGADGTPKPIRAGCGGFGIRNFLTLFLSIEVQYFVCVHVQRYVTGV